MLARSAGRTISRSQAWSLPPSSTPISFADAGRAAGARNRPQGFRELYETIDLPLASVLARMERNGHPHRAARSFKVLSEQLDASINASPARSTNWPARPFNINSPQQLGKVLFEDLSLPAPVKYGKGKTISTAADVLEGLAGEHEIARKVLDYRQLTKLKGTYVDALPALIDPRTGRVHTTFNQSRRGHRTAVVVESQSAEHSDPHRAGPRDSRRVRAARRLEADRRRLFADRAAAAGAHVARSGAGGRRSATARTSTPAPRPKFSAFRR
jgi:hypothetical protein